MDKLTIKQEKFVQSYVDTGGNGTQAIIQAGYRVKDREVAGVMSAQNLAKTKVKQAIDVKKADMAKVLEDNSMLLLTNLLEIAFNTNTPVAVRVKALQDLLDRAGYGSKKDITLSGGDTAIQMETRHTSDLAKRARELMTKNIKEEI